MSRLQAIVNLSNTAAYSINSDETDSHDNDVALVNLLDDTVNILTTDDDGIASRQFDTWINALRNTFDGIIPPEDISCERNSAMCSATLYSDVQYNIPFLNSYP